MKTKILLKLIILFATQLTSGQILYSENFDNLTIGNVGNDFTGTTLGKGGWYTYEHHNPNGNNNSFQITNEVAKGKIITINETDLGYGRTIEKKELSTSWKNRSLGNDILKYSFEIFTGQNISLPSSDNNIQYITISSKHRPLGNFWVLGNTKEVTIGGFNNSHTNSFYSAPYSQNKVYLPANSWVTLEIYVDYTTNKIYFGIPSLNLMVRYDAMNQLSPQIDGPEKISFVNIGSHNLAGTIKIKIDNINMSAINNAPTADIKNLISDKFNLYPNPAKNIINITNNENLGIELIKIYDTKGKLINTKTFSREPNVQLDISNYAVGTYLLHILTTNGTAIKKVIKK